MLGQLQKSCYVPYKHRMRSVMASLMPQVITSAAIMACLSYYGHNYIVVAYQQ
jgi:hypothetical protein